MKQYFSLSMIIEILIGVLFLLAAFLKAKDPNLFVAQIYGYGVITDPGQLRFVAIFATSIEAALGLALLIGLRLGILTNLATQAMLLFYTLLIAYAWAVNGLEDCGCFGDVKIPPQMGILKNILMMAALAVALWKKQADSTPHNNPILALKLLATVILGVATAFVIMPQLSKADPTNLTANTPPSIPVEADNPPNSTETQSPDPVAAPADPRFVGITGTHPLNGEAYDLAQGEYIVAMLNMDCDHCMESVPHLNDFTFDPNLPPVVAICWEPEPGKFDEFVAMTGPQFAMHSLGNDFLKFSTYIGGAPPRISILRDGQELHFWDKDAPAMDELYKKLDELRATSAGETAH